MQRIIFFVIISTSCFPASYTQLTDTTTNHTLFIGISTPMFCGLGPEIQYKMDDRWEIGGDFYIAFEEPNGNEDHKDWEAYVIRGYVIYNFVNPPKKFSPFGIVGFIYAKETYIHIVPYFENPTEEKAENDEKGLTLGVGSRFKISSRLYLDGEIGAAISDSWLGTDVDPWFRLGIEMGF